MMKKACVFLNAEISELFSRISLVLVTPIKISLLSPTNIVIICLVLKLTLRKTFAYCFCILLYIEAIYMCGTWAGIITLGKQLTSYIQIDRLK